MTDTDNIQEGDRVRVTESDDGYVAEGAIGVVTEAVAGTVRVMIDEGQPIGPSAVGTTTNRNGLGEITRSERGPWYVNAVEPIERISDRLPDATEGDHYSAGDRVTPDMIPHVGRNPEDFTVRLTSRSVSTGDARDLANSRMRDTDDRPGEITDRVRAGSLPGDEWEKWYVGDIHSDRHSTTFSYVLLNLSLRRREAAAQTSTNTNDHTTVDGDPLEEYKRALVERALTAAAEHGWSSHVDAALDVLDLTDYKPGAPKGKRARYRRATIIIEQPDTVDGRYRMPDPDSLMNAIRNEYDTHIRQFTMSATIEDVDERVTTGTPS